jgi:sulfatase modifying factor 1
VSRANRIPRLAALAAPSAAMLVSCAAIWGFQDLPAGGAAADASTDIAESSVPDSIALDSMALESSSDVASEARTPDAQSACDGPCPPSCQPPNATASSCGSSATEPCCAAGSVLAGTFFRSYDDVTYTDASFTASVAAFELDTYEITVGRFRAFVAAYPGNLPAAGAGKNPNDTSMPPDPGWDPSWNTTSMPASQAALESAIGSCAGGTWTVAAGGRDNVAMTCISWFEAFAFCIWDGGRLPTEAEWNYAAAGGAEQRAYPWSMPPMSTTIDYSYANYNCIGGNCSQPMASDILAVGTDDAKGDGKYGQADLAGNVWEFVVDWYASPYAINPCYNCADFSDASAAGGVRVTRGGSAYYEPPDLLASARSNHAPGGRSVDIGARCAR